MLATAPSFDPIFLTQFLAAITFLLVIATQVKGLITRKPPIDVILAEHAQSLASVEKKIATIEDSFKGSAKTRTEYLGRIHQRIDQTNHQMAEMNAALKEVATKVEMLHPRVENMDDHLRRINETRRRPA